MSIGRKKPLVLSFFGTRPEAIKMAPLIMALKSQRSLSSCTVVSGQHRDLLDSATQTFGLNIDHDLNVMKKNQSLESLTSRTMLAFSEKLKVIRPDLVLIHGDTTTSLAGALAAFYLQIPVGHVEAGLRTHDFNSPFPEEMNRTFVDKLSTLHFAPTKQAAQNLYDEGISKKRIYITGNTVIDALHHISHTVRGPESMKLKSLSHVLKSRDLILLTAHRRENFGEPFENIFRAIRTFANENLDVQIIYPLHPNPHVRKPALKILAACSNVHLIDPVTYPDLVWLLKGALFVVTDSGGLQEEAPALGKPVLVLRNVSERPEGIKTGAVKLAGTSSLSVLGALRTLYSNKRLIKKMVQAKSPYGDGQAASRIVNAIQGYFGFSAKRMKPFVA